MEPYYATAVPVVRLPDRAILDAACRALAEQVSDTLQEAGNQSDLRAAVEMTTLARGGWSFDDLWPYLHDTVCRIALDHLTQSHDSGWLPAHGLAWVEALDDDVASDGRPGDIDEDHA